MEKQKHAFGVQGKEETNAMLGSLEKKTHILQICLKTGDQVSLQRPLPRSTRGSVPWSHWQSRCGSPAVQWDQTRTQVAPSVCVFVIPNSGDQSSKKDGCGSKLKS